MQRTVDLLTNIKESLEIIQGNIETCKKRYIELNKQFDDLYHEIERMGKMDMYSAWLKLTEFQKVMQERRLVKGEMQIAEKAYGNLKHIKNAVNGAYGGAVAWEKRGEEWRKDFLITHDDIAM